MEIERVQHVTEELVAALRVLVAALSPGAPELTDEDVAAIVAADANTLLLARDERSAIVGTATVVLIRIPSGRRARLESVVVSAEARGKGVGEALCRAGIERARELGATAVDLTSAPARAAANRLYERLGFTRRVTNVYRLDLGR